MSVDGVKLFDNDFACDIRDDFFERYDAGSEPASLKEEIFQTYEPEILGEEDREFLLTALADCLWSVGHPVEDLGEAILASIDAEATAAFWGDLYPARKKELASFLRKLAKPKASPVRRQNSRVPTRLPFAEGDVLGFLKRNGKVVPVMVWLIETRSPLRYDFVFPNLSRASDPALVARFLDAPDRLTDDEIAAFFSKNKAAPVFTLEHKPLKPHLGRFRKFGNRPFSFPPWRGSSFGYGVTFEDFERRADEGGSRGLSAEERDRIGWPESPPAAGPTHADGTPL